MARQRPSSNRPNRQDPPEEYPLLPGTSTAPSSLRITRSSARLATEPTPAEPDTPLPPSASSRKRKASSRHDRVADAPAQSTATSSPRKAKRSRTAADTAPSTGPVAAAARQGARGRPAMSQPGPSSRPETKSTATPQQPRHKSSRHDQSRPTQSPPPRRQKKRSTKTNPDVVMRDASDEMEEDPEDEGHDSPTEQSNHGAHAFDDDDGDALLNSIFSGGAPMGLQSTLRALSGMMPGPSPRLRDILINLRAKDDPSLQLIALQELSDTLLVSNEDNLAGHFSPDPYVKELVTLMQPNQFGEDNPEIMLLACRSLANLMEALRGSVANVVYGGAVPILCQKLLDIQFIDLAEQALSTLAKISIDFPASIVREGGLTACLTYLDFFPTSTQRTAVTTAANCCRNLPTNSFPVVRDVMPTLLNVLASNDPKVVEQACLCVSRIVENFRQQPGRLEELIEPAMLKAVLRLLLPGTTNLVGPHIHTQFLRVLAITSKSSARLSNELLKMDVVDTLYQILTGVSAPDDVSNTAVKMDSVLVMQALIHRPREQVFETLNVICELLPGVPSPDASRTDHLLSTYFDSHMAIGLRSAKTEETVEERRSLFGNCKNELKRFAMILFPTLTDAYSSTVNLHVRQKVLIAQMKMLHLLEPSLIEDALRSVPYASFLASILSQQDHPSLVSLALRCSELLFHRLENVYQHQFHREGVVSEIMKLSQRPLSAPSGNAGSSDIMTMDITADSSRRRTQDSRFEEDEDANNEEDEDDEDEEIEDDDGDNMSDSDNEAVYTSSNLQKLETALNDVVIRDAQAFLEVYEASHGEVVRVEALKILNALQSLASDIRSRYKRGADGGFPLFEQLASYFDGHALESITSSELLNSGIIQVLLDVLGNYQASSLHDARAAFLQAFIGVSISDKAQSQSTATTPFSVLIRKLQDLLSRTEHFEVLTISHNSLQNTRSNASYMLSKQLRLKLVADEPGDSQIPRPYNNLILTVHAIAPFHALNDFLYPRIAMAEKPRSSRSSRDSIFAQLQTAARLRHRLASSSGVLPRHTSGPNGSTVDGAESTSGRQRHRRSAQPYDEDEEQNDEPLECADERQLADEDDEADEDDDELNPIEDLDDDLEDDNVSDPSAVNMEVGTEGKVTARREDGTRVGTPSHSSTGSRPSSSMPNPHARSRSNTSLATAGRPFSSYAAATASVPQDWHLEFFVDGKSVDLDTTIYRGVHHNREDVDEASSKNVWSSLHTIKYRRVPGPPRPEPSALPSTSQTASSKGDSFDFDIPVSLSKDLTTMSIIRLLRVLYEMNATIDDILTEVKDTSYITSEPLAQFINTKLTAKINRQLEEPLIVASDCLPSWSEDLARLFSFLFPFETRHLFLQSTAFGYSRAMLRWQASLSGEESRRDMHSDNRPFIGKLQRQKVRISRTRILDSALKVMELYGSSPSILEIEYFEEVGTGLGPTLEFYSTVSKEFSRKDLDIWRDTDGGSTTAYAFGKNGLFPAPMGDQQANDDDGKKQLGLFKVLGKFVARSMLDSRIIDISFNPAFFRIADTMSSVAPSLGTVKAVDPDLAKSLIMLRKFVNEKNAVENDNRLSPNQKAEALQDITVDGVKVDDLSLDFTLPGYPAIELIPGGADVPLSIENVDTYIERVIDMTLGSGVRRQVEAFRAGFSQVFPYSSLSAFTPSELVMLFGQADEDWSIETLMDSIKADHGFNMDSRSVRNLLQTMSELDDQQRRNFLQFVTGSPKLPIGGFKSLTPTFTVVCRPSEHPYTADDYLPSVMTCVNYLKLPDYSDLDTLKRRLFVAIKEGQGAFHLS